MRNDGKIGIGTAATSTSLAVGGDVYVQGSLSAATVSGSLTGTLNAANVSSGTFGSNTSFGNFTFGTSTNPILHIDNANARVGVGTTSPGQKLEVIGNVSSTAVCLGGTCESAWPSSGVTGSGTATRVSFWSDTTALSSDSNLYWDNTNKRLGVGTGTPSTPLHVTGQITAGAAQGTAPLVINSTTKVANLNADLLDGLDSSAFGDATAANQNTILARVDNAYSAGIPLMGIGSAPACPGGWSDITGQLSAGSFTTNTSGPGSFAVTPAGSSFHSSYQPSQTVTTAAGHGYATNTLYYRVCGLPR